MSSVASSDSTNGATPLKVIVYSDDRTVRQQVRLALGRKIARDLPEIAVTEFATQDALFEALDHEHFDLAILDGEAVPSGGMGISHQMKDELASPPPVVLLIARPTDAWLAAWSNAEAISPYPIDPIRLPDTAAEVVRRARSGQAFPMKPEPEPAPGSSSRHAPDKHDQPQEMAE
ncbi:response regulator [Propionibacterium freudenreichii]|uniref:response regulator n=1 Tax=Propionibacterium freudenreichii TaxID=1744 RepID=UPI00254F544C|nr:response regulator [Propionibacterium freudenreichii]MDK9671427.1 response regulator transcription factor [Propionibacterium freudenreichii]